MKKVDWLYQYSIDRLSKGFGLEEARSLAFRLLSERYGLSRADIIMGKEVRVNAEELESDLYRLLQNEPIQYVLGWAWFDGLQLKVTPETLIPRPETEELVEWVFLREKYRQGPSIIDLGTGSGCIPLALKRRFPQAKIKGLDLSEGALAVASENAKQLKMEVEFEAFDIPNDNLPASCCDILVSNPPYIRPSEKELMEANVLDYEPEQALFIPEIQPLLFYEKIAVMATSCLSEGGSLYFEINEAFGREVCDLLSNLRFKNIEIKKDMQGKDRMVRAER